MFPRRNVVIYERFCCKNMNFKIICINSVNADFAKLVMDSPKKMSCLLGQLQHDLVCVSY